jgi:hypothetical protein
MFGSSDLENQLGLLRTQGTAECQISRMFPGFVKRCGMFINQYEVVRDANEPQATKQSELLMSFNETTMTLEDKTLRYDSRRRATLSNKLFKIDDETKLLVEIMGIQDELNMVNSVLEYQKEVLHQLSRIYISAKEKANAAKDKANAAKEKADAKQNADAAILDGSQEKAQKGSDGKKSVRFDIQDPDDVSRPADLI